MPDANGQETYQEYTNRLFIEQLRAQAAQNIRVYPTGTQTRIQEEAYTGVLYAGTVGATHTRLNLPEESNTMKQPLMVFPTKLGKAGQNAERLEFKLSDLRRVLKKLKDQDDTYVAKILMVKPIDPLVRYHNISPYNLYRVNNVNELLLETTRVTVAENLKWNVFDQWTKQWVPLPTVAGGDIVQPWLDYIEQLKKFNRGEIFETVATSLKDYLNNVWKKLNWNRQSKYDSVNNNIDSLSSQKRTALAKKFNVEGRDNFRYFLEELNVGSPYDEGREHIFAQRRLIPIELRYPLQLQHHRFSEFLMRAYSKRYPRDIISKNFIVWSNSTKSFEYEYEGFTPRINRETLVENYVELIPNRLLRERLFVPVKCCGDTIHYQHSINLFDAPKNIEDFLDKYRALKEERRQVRRTPPPFPAGQASSKTLKWTQESIEKSIQGVLIDNFKDGKYTKNNSLVSALPPIPPLDPPLKVTTGWWQNANKLPLFVCTDCYHKIWQEGLRERDRQGIETTRYIKDYTTNPLGVFTGFNLGQGEKPLQSRVTRAITNSAGKTIYQNLDMNNTLYMGVELEVTPSKFICDLLLKGGVQGQVLREESRLICAKIVTEFLNAKEMGIIKRDGSIESGFEIVTVPGTHKWHINEAWQGFFKEDYEDAKKHLAPSTYLSGWINNGGSRKAYAEYLGARYDICGIHVHVARNAITSLQLDKMLKFFGLDENKKFIEHIAGRSENRYSKIMKKKLGTGKFINRIRGGTGPMPHQVGDGEQGRREAINLQTGTKPTIEFRIFRSNVSKIGFLKNLDFVHSFVTWANLTSYQEVDYQYYCRWLSENRGPYKFLTRWMEKNGYIVTLHDFNPKYTKEYIEDEADEDSKKVA